MKKLLSYKFTLKFYRFSTLLPTPINSRLAFTHLQLRNSFYYLYFRPDVILLYMDLVDHAGHDNGPNSEDVDIALAEADFFVGMLMDGLKQRQLDKCANMIILADHGT